MNLNECILCARDTTNGTLYKTPEGIGVICGHCKEWSKEMNECEKVNKDDNLKDYTVRITETYMFEVGVEGENKIDAISKAKICHKYADDGVVGVPDDSGFQKASFKIINSN